MKETLAFDDVLLVPKYSEVVSRASISTMTFLRDIQFKCPIISSPMDTVTEATMAYAMAEQGGLGIIHRYNAASQQASLVKSVCTMTDGYVGAAIGVSDDIERAHMLVEAGAKILCVDIAHGHHILMKNTLRMLREHFGEEIYIIAGNVATCKGYEDLSDWGADAVRLSIGGGSICSTRIQTGHGVPTLQAVFDCAQSDRSAAIIADGGIRNSGDICKAIAAGADFVMLGSLLAGTDETPGEVLSEPHVVNGRQEYRKFKVYRGMASVEAQIDWRGHAASVEGVSSTVPYKGPVEAVIEDLMRGLKSGMSYSGANRLSTFRHNAEFVKQTTSGKFESNTHINHI